ncbi:MAG: radical SAM protein [Lachnospiraceae bacterium]|nr:radical SAM protein [Lachnospiraceae bacterium]
MDSPFSTIYIEENAESYPLTDEILSRLPRAEVVPIHHYKDIFDRPGANDSPALILAVKKDSFLYDGSQNCQAFGAPRAFYALPAMGCPFDCQYCFLKGMYPTSNIVAFVNIEDCLTEIRELAKGGPAQVSLSYETDLVAIDHLTGFVSKFAALAPEVPDLTLEIRTKAANILSHPLRRPNGAAADSLHPLQRPNGAAADSLHPGQPNKDVHRASKVFSMEFSNNADKIVGGFSAAPNFVFSFTLSPQSIIDRFEKKTPGLSQRLSAVKAAQDAGFTVRLCFDPMILTPGWRKMYTEFFGRIRSEVDFAKVRDVSVGSFRIPRDYLKNMRKNYGETEVSLFPYTLENGTYTYGEAETELLKVAMDGLLPVFPQERIFPD